MKSDSPFFSNRIVIVTHFSKVIRNCESLFANYSHFCTPYMKFAYKKRKFCFKRGENHKKILANPFENDLQYQKKN